MSARHISGAAITRSLELDDRFTGRVPSERTIQDIVRDLTPPDPSEPWTLADADADADADAGDAALVFPVLAAVITESEGRRDHLTRTEARWVARIRRAATDLPLPDCYLLARMYMVRAARNERVGDLDALLAIAPWRGPERLYSYYLAVSAERLRPPPQFLSVASSFNRAVVELGEQWAAIWLSNHRRAVDDQSEVADDEVRGIVAEAATAVFRDHWRDLDTVVQRVYARNEGYAEQWPPATQRGLLADAVRAHLKVLAPPVWERLEGTDGGEATREL